MMIHKVIIGKRQTGKTGRLIKESAEKWIPIVCASYNEANDIVRRAKELKLDIPKPIVANRKTIDLDLKVYNSVLVDDAVLVLEQLLGKHIESVTINTGHDDPESIEVINTEGEDKENASAE